MKRLFAGIFSAVACGGCISFTPPATAPRRAPVPVSASFGRTWDAVIDAFADKNVAIRTIDRTSGLIAADPVIIPSLTGEATKPSELADCGSRKAAGVPTEYALPTSAVYNVRVRGDSSSSTVLVTVRWVTGQTRHFLAGEECASSGLWEGQIESTVKTRAERH
jgi:hypothetical protein